MPTYLFGFIIPGATPSLHAGRLGCDEWYRTTDLILRTMRTHYMKCDLVRHDYWLERDEDSMPGIDWHQDHYNW